MTRRRAQTFRQSPRGLADVPPNIVLSPREWNRVFENQPHLQDSLYAVLATCSVVAVEVFLLGLGITEYVVE